MRKTAADVETTNLINHCYEWDNVRIRTGVRIYGKIWPEPSGFPSR